mmetsp:Transcript_14514/g.39801  ORF Transcript_14514/g.39801 Transcript_14514/m.39801 type:complete len:362 (-) Transcript_14514:3974-5059(-)
MSVVHSNPVVAKDILDLTDDVGSRSLNAVGTEDFVDVVRADVRVVHHAIGQHVQSGEVRALEIEGDFVLVLDHMHTLHSSCHGVLKFRFRTDAVDDLADHQLLGALRKCQGHCHVECVVLESTDANCGARGVGCRFLLQIVVHVLSRFFFRRLHGLVGLDGVFLGLFIFRLLLVINVFGLFYSVLVRWHRFIDIRSDIFITTVHPRCHVRLLFTHFVVGIISYMLGLLLFNRLFFVSFGESRFLQRRHGGVVPLFVLGIHGYLVSLFTSTYALQCLRSRDPGDVCEFCHLKLEAACKGARHELLQDIWGEVRYLAAELLQRPETEGAVIRLHHASVLELRALLDDDSLQDVSEVHTSEAHS